MIFKFIQSMGWQEHELVIKFYGKKNEMGEGFQVRNIRIIEKKSKHVLYKSPNERKQDWMKRMELNKEGKTYHNKGGEITARKKAIKRLFQTK